MTPTKDFGNPNELMKMLGDFGKSNAEKKKLSEEQQAKIDREREQFHDALNTLFATEYGEYVMGYFVKASRYWQSIYEMDSRIQAQFLARQEFVRELILNNLTDDNLAKIIAKTRSEKHG